MISFSEPFVLLKRNATKPAGKLASNERQKDTAATLAKKGNHGVDAYDPHKCCICQKALSNRPNLVRHLETVHGKGKKFFCDLCPKFCLTKGAISDHVRTHAKRSLACNICDYKTAFRAHLKVHKLSHVEKVECPICKKEVRTLKSHLKSHQQMQSCSICQKILNKWSMKDHMKVHEIQTCAVCGESFESKDLRRFVKV